ncbi:Membrane protein involved in the export of O-antigen and teichoic acid [Ruminococcus flavefaciens]|uniref:Membrane protein involved in the export of O-antigen and teichoic acid n=1 Tax=Ruminococcus flavefaciens TaxID=1265 RepID=A0A1H6JS66_RUMFL|nr:lipopolysaccharide biosynthesis protein [Ruminococcus flavefaciens]SEH65355.1 Membrane protein involved in the export of O-antigen and teichoic acid [Ruminococcus flavefaciens]
MSSRDTVVKNLFWRLGERFGAKMVQFIVQIVLAKMLAPKLMGTIGLILVFIEVLQIFIESGLGNALIQKKDADDLDFSSVFYFNCLICGLAYLLMFFSAPFIADFYNKPELTPIIRVMSLVLIVSGMKNVQQAYVSRNMMFKRFFFATLIGTIVAAVVGITMAYTGFGLWAIVAQNLVNVTIDTMILWLTVKWRPKRCFSFKRLKYLYSYGWKLFASSLMEVIYLKLRNLIIGKRYSDESLAFYTYGEYFPQFITSILNSSLDSVLLPSMAKVQDSRESVKNMTRRSIKIGTFLMMPFMVGIMVCAAPVVRIVLTEDWLPVVPYLRILCISYAFMPIHTANLNAIKAIGRSDTYLKLEIIKKFVDFASILATMFISVKAMVYGVLVSSIISQVINAWPNKKLLNYSYLEQVVDMIPQIIASAIMGGVICLINFIDMNYILMLAIQVPLGVAVYILCSKFMHIDSYEYLMDTLKSLLNRKKDKKI